MFVTQTGRRMPQSTETPARRRTRYTSNASNRCKHALTALSAAVLTGLYSQASVATDIAVGPDQAIWRGGLAISDTGGHATRTSKLRLTHGRASFSNGGSQHSEMSVLTLLDDDIFDSRAGAELEQSAFSMTQRAGDGFLHFGSQVSNDEYRVHSGFSISRVLMMVNVASGDSATQLGAGGFGFVDPFFFHGGLNQSFRSRSGAVAFDFNESLTAHASHLTLESAEMDKRSTSTLGLTGSRWHSHALHIQRDDETAARGLDLGFTMGPVDTQLQALQSSTEAYTAKLSFGFMNKANRYVQLHVQQDRNPLYKDGEDTRFMLSFSGILGGGQSNLFKANEADAEPTPEEETRRRNRKTLMIAGIGAGAAAGVALASSSGDSDNDGNARFPTERNAARNILNQVNPKSVRENREYGGWVYRRRDGTFSYTNPNKGTNDSVILGDINAVPRGARTTASYHTHAAFDPRYDNENFSPQDKFVSIVNQVDGYLGTPFGVFKFYDWQRDTVTTLGRVAN